VPRYEDLPRPLPRAQLQMRFTIGRNDKVAEE